MRGSNLPPEEWTVGQEKVDQKRLNRSFGIAGLVLGAASVLAGEEISTCFLGLLPAALLGVAGFYFNRLSTSRTYGRQDDEVLSRYWKD